MFSKTYWVVIYIRPDGFEKQEIEFIKINYNNMTYKEINDYLNNTFNKNRTEKQIRRKARHLDLSKYNTTIDKNYFETINNEQNAYWLGFIYADGYVVKQKTSSELGIQLSYVDIEHLEKFNKCIKGNLNIKIIDIDRLIRNNKKNTVSKGCLIRIHSKKIVADLESHNVKQRKTYLNTYPCINDDKLFFSFLRGYFDGDGCIWFEKKNVKNVYCKITSLNNNILLHIQDRLKKYNIASKIYHTQSEDSNIYNLHIRGNFDDKLRFLNAIYKNSEIYLDRKYKLYKDAVQIRNSLNN